MSESERIKWNPAEAPMTRLVGVVALVLAGTILSFEAAACMRIVYGAPPTETSRPAGVEEVFRDPPTILLPATGEAILELPKAHSGDQWSVLPHPITAAAVTRPEDPENGRVSVHRFSHALFNPQGAGHEMRIFFVAMAGADKRRFHLEVRPTPKC